MSMNKVGLFLASAGLVAGGAIYGPGLFNPRAALDQANSGLKDQMKSVAQDIAKDVAPTLVSDPFAAWQPEKVGENSGLNPLQPGSLGLAPGAFSASSQQFSGQIQAQQLQQQLQSSPTNPMGGGSLPAISSSPTGPNSNVVPQTQSDSQSPTAQAPLDRVVLRGLITASETRAYLEVNGQAAKPFKVGSEPIQGLKILSITARGIEVASKKASVRLRVGQEYTPQ